MVWYGCGMVSYSSGVYLVPLWVAVHIVPEAQLRLETVVVYKWFGSGVMWYGMV